MKLASFTLNARPAWGPVVDGGVIDATSQHPSLKAALDAIAFLPTIPDPGKVWCCGAMGPWMVTADEIPFGTSMTLITRLNGAERTPPLWMKPGDVVEIEIDRVGVLRNPIAQE